MCKETPDMTAGTNGGSMYAMIYKCMYCHEVYKSLPSDREEPLYSHGVCPDCEPEMWRRNGMARGDWKIADTGVGR